MRRAGQPLDDWQQDSINEMLAVRADGKWSCFEFCEWCSRQNGKGGILEARVLAGLFLLGERLLMWSAHEYKTAMEAFRRVLWLLGNLGTKINENLYDVDGVWVKVIHTNGEEGLERLDTGQRLKFIARSKGSGRGFSGDVNIIDESFAYTTTQQAALMFTMSARPNPQIIYASSPPLTGDTGDVMYALRWRGDPTAPRAADDPPWEQDDSLGYRDWGLGGDLDHLDGVDLDDEANWAGTNPAYGIRISREQTARELRAMKDTPEDFARERLGVWPFRPGEGLLLWQVIGEADWTDALDDDSQIVGTVAFAAAVSVDRSRASIAACGRRADGKLHVEITSQEIAPGVDQIDSRPGTPWVPARLLELKRRYRPCAVVLDTSGATGSLIPDVEKLGIEVLPVGTGDAAKAWAMFYDAVSGTDVAARNLRHIGQEELTAAVAGADKRPLGDGFAWDRRNAAVDISPLVAATCAVWGFALKGHTTRAKPKAVYA